MTLELAPKDYVCTTDGWLFAVLSERLEQGRVLAWPRYRRRSAAWHKLSLEQAGPPLSGAGQPEHYHWHSAWLDAALYAVPLTHIVQTWHPRQGLQKLLGMSRQDPKRVALCKLVRLLTAHGIDNATLGVTGSLLIGAHNTDSDMDLVVYGRENFFAVLGVLRTLLHAGMLQPLGRSDWRRVWQRRACALDRESYIWHELRKGNKYLLDGSRLDIGMLALPAERIEDRGPWRKCGRQRLRAEVSDARGGFDYPARYRIRHPRIAELVCYTASYVGQAFSGERVEAAGHVEVNPQGERRLLIGSSRTAGGEFIRLCQDMSQPRPGTATAAVPCSEPVQ